MPISNRMEQAGASSSPRRASLPRMLPRSAGSPCIGASFTPQRHCRWWSRPDASRAHHAAKQKASMPVLLMTFCTTLKLISEGQYFPSLLQHICHGLSHFASKEILAEHDCPGLVL
jgi:hypothetical protein